MTNTINKTSKKTATAKSATSSAATQLVPKSQNTLITELTGLLSKREKWQGTYDRTNTRLYDLLAGCLEFYYKTKGKPDEKAVVKMLKEELEKREMKIQKNTTVFLLIVRYVFNAERRRSHVYARALAVAVNSGVTKAGFAKWVRDAGGIEEVVTNGSTNSTKNKREDLSASIQAVNDMLSTQIEKPLAMVPKSNLIKVTESGDYTLLIGKTRADGKTSVLSVVPNASDKMLKAAIRNIALELAKQVEEIQKPKLDAERQAIMSEMLAEALGNKKAPKLKQAA